MERSRNDRDASTSSVGNSCQKGKMEVKGYRHEASSIACCQTRIVRLGRLVAAVACSKSSDCPKYCFRRKSEEREEGEKTEHSMNMSNANTKSEGKTSLVEAMVEKAGRRGTSSNLFHRKRIRQLHNCSL